MYLKYGSYTHPLGEASWTITRTPERDQSNRIIAMDVVWAISGMLSTQEGTAWSAIHTKRLALEAAYSADGKNAYILSPTGSIVHQLLSYQTVGGTKVQLFPSYPDGRGAQHATHLSYNLTISGKLPSTSAPSVLEFSESVQTSGGGARIVYVETAVGLAQKQLGRRYTLWEAVQQGRAVGRIVYPTPVPIWPSALVEEPQIQRENPIRDGNDYWRYPIQWSYKFQAPLPLSGVPRRWSM